jgi:hypothetical protein
MSEEKSFGVASKNLHSQKFDDEILIIDTKSGLYFSLRGAAVDIWSQIEACATRSTIEAALRGRYNGDANSISVAVDRCLAELLRDGLIRAVTHSSENDLDIVSPTAKQPFSEPLIERFTDMQNLLLLDPIHEVSEEGWPRQ